MKTMRKEMEVLKTGAVEEDVVVVETTEAVEAIEAAKISKINNRM